MPKRKTTLIGVLYALLLAGATTALAQKNVVQPGDPIIASSSNSPGSEGVANAIDGQPTKYLNFDTRTGGKASGFVVTPSVGVTRVVGVSLQSANDAPERDPKLLTIEGSNDDTIADFASGTWELVSRLENIPAFAARFQTQTLFFDNFKAYKHYRFTVIETQTENTCCFQIAEVGLLGSLLPQDVTQPGDPIIASSSNSPGSEGVANAIDGQPTKYLNFDTRTGGKASGFVVSPSLGSTLISGITLQSANDAPERDAKVVTIEGSNDDTVADFASGNWELVKRFDDIPAYTARFQTQTFLFDNYKPYKHYRFTVIATQTENTCCFQVAEVELLGTGAPQDVTQPGDAIIASSSNSPGSEGVANAIDGQPTKYLNFDTRADGKPSGFVVTPGIGESTIIGVSLQSANDGPERDAKVVTIEGSNDETVADFASGNWEQIVKLDNIPAYTARFQTQQFFFPNRKSYKHYRFTVLETQTVNTCCFQIAEVELLAVVDSNPCDKARFLVQPSDTPVLSGSQATFITAVNGPWSLQWYANGQAIPGATKVTYTTGAVTADNSTNVYTVEIKGCEVSSPAKAVVFTPSATKSIGISFRGGGANGAPTLMNKDDIAGLQPQAYWNNTADAGTGTFPYEQGTDPVETIELVDSDNKATTITFDFQTSGTWGAGSGDASSVQRMLNGLNYANPGTPATLTFGNVPAGNHSVIAYFVGIPLQFQNANYTVTGASTETYYVRVINADEYNAAPGFYRGISKDANNRSLATYVRFDNVRAAADGTIILSWDTLTTGFDRGAPVNALQLILNSTAAGAPPVITANPQPTIGPEGKTVALSVTATGDNLTYQWRKGGRNLPNGGHISGATTSTLTISSLADEDVGVYSVAVFNPGGSVVSGNASVRISKYDIKDALVGYWKFDEASGTSAANSGGGKVATVTGTPSWGAGQVANAFSFDGVSYMTVPDYPVAKTELSASAWVHVPADVGGPIAFVRNAQGQIGIGAGAGPGTPAGQFELGISYDANTGIANLSAAIGAGPNIVRVTAPTAFAYGPWTHVAFSADGAQLRLYVNGVEVATTDYLNAINNPGIPYLTFGARLNDDGSGVVGPDATAPSYMAGQLDDLGLWTRGLTGQEVQLVYQAGQQKKALDTVTVPQPAADIMLEVARSGGNIVVSWPEGRLQSAASAAGPWSDVAGATSPLTEAASAAAKFYRAVSP
jgi:hypothetical protein